MPARTPPRHLVGRGEELASIDEFLADDRGGAALVLEGEAGIGKTRLWEAGVERARELGHTVLLCRPAEGEASLPFAGLGDLLEGRLLDPLLPRLPDVQRSALEVALLRRPPEDAPPDRLASSRAVLAVLQALAGRAPLLVAIDDVQWLDAPSARVVEFAWRRLTGAPARLLLSRRTAGAEAPPLGLGRDRSTELAVGPLPPEDVGSLLADVLSLHLSRPRLLELHRMSAGNPFFALEIGRELLRTDPSATGPLPVPGSIGGLLRLRLDRLSAPARQAALLCAASTQAAAELVERAAGTTDGLAEALGAGVLDAAGERLRFTHPLLASVTYASATPWERRDAHRRLALAARDLEERARHLALAAAHADEAVADELEQASAQAAARGAPEAAATLAERAAELTPPDRLEDRRRRLEGAADLHLQSGDPARARAILAGLAADLPAGPERADLLRQLADVGDRFDESIALCEQAVEEALGDPGAQARAHMQLAILTWVAGDLARSIEHSKASARLAEEAGDELAVALALADLCYRSTLLGVPYSEADMARAREIEQRHDAFPAFQRPSFQLGLILTHTDFPNEARPLLRAELDRLESSGNESWQIGVLFRIADLELRAGNWGEASRLAYRSMALGRHAGIPQERSLGLMIHGLVQAHIGHLDEAEEAARTALSLSEEVGDRHYAIRSLGVLGFAALSRGDAGAALGHLEPGLEGLRRIGIGELSIHHVVQNAIDALVALGKLDEAEATIAWVEEKGRPCGRAWHGAVAARGRALVAAARGELDEAIDHAERALVAQERVAQPFELGRTLLVKGTIERRAKHRAAARATLERALETFDLLGAPLWAEKAAAELARISGRQRSEGGLTETERRVAELVAEGRSNKEVAAALFVTVRTVEANLSKVYAKLGIRSRTELARHLAPGA